MSIRGLISEEIKILILTLDVIVNLHFSYFPSDCGRKRGKNLKNRRYGVTFCPPHHPLVDTVRVKNNEPAVLAVENFFC